MAHRGTGVSPPDVSLPVDATALARALAAIRILIGFTYLSNGLAKVFGFHEVAVGPYLANLINRADARFILDFEVNKNARHQLPLIGRITNDVILAHWGVFSWGITLVEVAAGILLVVGLVPRIGALLALGPASFLFFVYFANDRWLPEQFLGLVPLLVLAVVPSGYAWGLDDRLERQPGRWPL